MTPFRRIVALSRPHLRYFLGGLIAAAFVGLLDLSLAYAIKTFIKMGNGRPELLSAVCWLVLAIYGGKWLFGYQQMVLLSTGVYRLATDLRARLYNHLHALSISFFDRQRTGQILSRMTNDVNVIQTSAPLFVEMITAPVKGVGGVVGMFVLNWRLTIAALLIVPLMALAITRIGGKMRSLSSLLQMRLADIAEIVEETVSGMRIIKSFAAEDYEMERFAERNREGYRAAMRGARRSAALGPTVELIGALGTILILIYGGYLVAQGHFQWDSLVPFIYLMTVVASSARHIGRINVSYQTMMGAAERVFEILDDKPDVAESPDAADPGKLQGRVTFENVTFSYLPKATALADVSLDVAPGEIVALVGPSGAGKSTVASLIPRFYDPSQGRVLVDGQDVRGLKLAPLRRQIAVVPQETMLFAASIRENIAYGRRDATSEQIEDAARAANAHDFILKTPEGYETVLGDRGARISLGQRQRIAIARAILADPAILILDEATSSLDAESERLVQEALEILMRGRTTFVIAHRLVTITKADRIIVMDRGRIVETGVFDELMRGDTLFRRLYEIQHRTTGDASYDI